MGTKYQNPTLIIPNDFTYLPVILGFTAEMARLAGFDARQVQQIELAVEEAVSNVIRHAFYPGEKALFDVSCRQEAARFVVIVHDEGKPFDPEQVPTYVPGESETDYGVEGLGSFLMKSMVDQVEYQNLGTHGKEVRLIKNLPYTPVAAELPGDQEKPEWEELDSDLQVRPMSPEQGIEVSRCFFAAYGYSYYFEDIYYPERMVALNQSGELVSTVVVNSSNQVISHSALIMDPDFPGVAEVGMNATLPAYQGRSINKMIGREQVRIARELGLSGAFTTLVTNHTYSQRLVFHFGQRECGFQLAHLHSEVSFRGIDEEVAERISLLLTFNRTDKLREQLTIHPPERHTGMILKIYEHLETSVSLGTPGSPAVLSGPTLTKLRIEPRLESAMVIVNGYGMDFAARFRAILNQIKREGLKEVQVYLNLTDPLTPWAAQELEDLGFIFTGILPGVSSGDLLIMQYFNGIVVYYDGIQVYTDMARELLNYIRRLDPLGNP